MSMQVFLDTADLHEIEKALKLGPVDGVTTNPSLVAKTGRPFKKVIQEICQIIEGPVSAEVLAVEKDEMVAQGLELKEIADNVVVKIPLTSEGLKAALELFRQGVATNVTLCFSPLQALMAAKCSATYVSPFIGRLDDVGHEGMQLISQIRAIYDRFKYGTKILAASIRHPQHVLQAALLGADCVTVPFKVYEQLFKHPLTEQGLKIFLTDAQSLIWS